MLKSQLDLSGEPKAYQICTPTEQTVEVIVVREFDERNLGFNGSTFRLRVLLQTAQLKFELGVSDFFHPGRSAANCFHPPHLIQSIEL